MQSPHAMFIGRPVNLNKFSAIWLEMREKEPVWDRGPVNGQGRAKNRLAKLVGKFGTELGVDSAVARTRLDKVKSL